MKQRWMICWRSSPTFCWPASLQLSDPHKSVNVWEFLSPAGEDVLSRSPVPQNAAHIFEWASNSLFLRSRLSVSDRVAAHTWTFCSSSSCVVCTYLILCGCYYTPLLVERAHVCVLARTLLWGEGRVISDASRLIGLARRPSPPHL